MQLVHKSKTHYIKMDHYGYCHIYTLAGRDLVSSWFTLTGAKEEVERLEAL